MAGEVLNGYTLAALEAVDLRKQKYNSLSKVEYLTSYHVF
jgi:hypothetical protein